MMRSFGIPCQIGEVREFPFADAREEIAEQSFDVFLDCGVAPGAALRETEQKSRDDVERLIL
jgi:hypothetical protein